MIKNENGSVMIEAAIVFSFLVLMIVVIFNTAINFSNKTKLENISYYLASLIRENSLYEKKTFTIDDKDNIFKIAQNLSKNFVKNESDLGIKIEIYNYSENSSKNIDDNKEIFIKGECESQSELEPKDFIGETENSLVLVTLCLNNQKRFTDLSNIFNDNSLIVAKSLAVKK